MCTEADNSKPKQLTAAILCDLSKAFDVINYDILFEKLDHYGIRGIAKNWLVNYLSNRKQFVVFKNAKSKHCKIDCGVPQGSILGPLLYLIYVNDIGNCTEEHLLSFADDTTLILSSSDEISLFHKANLEMDNLYDWFCANRLSLNPQKTKYIIIKAPRAKCDLTGLNISINGTPLSRVVKGCKERSTKFLGVYIDDTLSWKSHVE